MAEASPVQPFMLLGMGATRFDPAGGRTAATRFSFAIRGGVTWLWTDHVGLRPDGLWTPVLVPRGSRFFCSESAGGECYITETNSYLSRAFPVLSSFDFTIGLLLRY